MIILGDPGATSWDDAIFSGERHFWRQTEEPLGTFPYQTSPRKVEIRPADWPENILANQRGDLEEGAYHLAKKCRNFGLKSNGKVIFRTFRSEIVEYLQRYSSFSIRNGTTEISLPFGKFSSFQSLISRKQ